jgi:hypothetical protein
MLAAIPYLLGYRPVDCVVMVGVTSEGRLGPVAHVTLDDLRTADPGDLRLVARRAADTGACRAVVAVYTQGPVDASAGVRTDLASTLSALHEEIDDVETWLVTPDGFRGLDCLDPTCCPPAGHSCDQLETGPVSAAFVLSGRSVASTAAEAFQVPRAPSSARGLAGRAARRWEQAGEAVTADGAARRAWVHDGCAGWRQALRHATTELALNADDEDLMPPPAPVPPATLGRLAAALADTEVRDSVLLSLVADACEPAAADRGPSGAPSADDEDQAAEACARMLDPRVAVVPDTSTTTAARMVLEATVAHAPRRLQAAPLTLLGLVAWWRGEGGLAAARTREALAIDADYRLAVLLSDILAAAVPPGWVRRSSADGVR